MTTTITLGTIRDIREKRLPPQLQGVLDVSTWERIVHELSTPQDEALKWVCLAEWGFCCLTGCIFVFCGHPCWITLGERQLAEE